VVDYTGNSTTSERFPVTLQGPNGEVVFEYRLEVVYSRNATSMRRRPAHTPLHEKLFVDKNRTETRRSGTFDLDESHDLRHLRVIVRRETIYGLRWR